MKKTLNYLRQHLILLVIIIPAWILTLIPLVFDGQNGCVNGTCGFIVGTNYRDGLWFQAVATTAFNAFPFQMPNYAGEVLRGYHYLPNLIAFLFSKLGIPIAVTFYKIIPVFFVGTLTIISIALARKLKDSPLFVGIFLFFTFFGMHLSLITSLYHFGEIRNSVLINTFQATRLLESPHAALAMLLLYAVLLLLLKKKRSLRDSALIAIMIFLATGTKFYVAFSMLTIVGIFELVSLKKTKMEFILFCKRIGMYLVGGALGIILFYDPLNASSSGGIFIFSPFATVHHLIESPDLFYHESMINARYFLYEAGWSPRLLLIELYSTALFILFYFGTRVVGFIQMGKQLLKRSMSHIDIAVSISILLSTVIAVMFIQKGDWFNPIQFAVPAAYLMTIFVSRLLVEVWQSQRIIGSIVIAVMVLLTFPANLANATYLTNPGRFVIPENEMEALELLKKQPDGVVFHPIEENDMAYVSALTGKQTYVNFTNTLENAGLDFSNRLMIATKNQLVLDQEDEVTFLYLPKSHKDFQKMYSLCGGIHFEEIYKNKGAVICKRK